MVNSIKVAEIYSDMKFNMDKKSMQKMEAEAKDSADKIGKTYKQVGTTTKSMFASMFSKMGALASVTAVLGAVKLVGDEFLKVVQSADDLYTKASGLGLSVAEMQKVERVAIEGSVDKDALTKDYVRLKEAMSDLSKGIKTDATKRLQEAGITGNEGTYDAMQQLVKSMKASTEDAVIDAMQDLKFKRTAESMQFYNKSGAGAFDTTTKGYANNLYTDRDEKKVEEGASINAWRQQEDLNMSNKLANSKDLETGYKAYRSLKDSQDRLTDVTVNLTAVGMELVKKGSEASSTSIGVGILANKTKEWIDSRKDKSIEKTNTERKSSKKEDTKRFVGIND